jgi:hypothetical protein
MSLTEADLELTQLAMAAQPTNRSMLEEFGFGETYEQQNFQADPGDAALFVRFFLYPWLNKQESTQQGRPIYYDREFIEIIQPGNKESIINRPASDIDKRRFSKQYGAFKSQTSQTAAVGTPLEHWAAMSRAQVEELKYFGCHTVEQLAVMSDGITGKFMGLQSFKLQAQAYLEKLGTSAEGSKLAHQLEEQANELETLKNQMKDLSDQLAAERAAAKRK